MILRNSVNNNCFLIFGDILKQSKLTLEIGPIKDLKIRTKLGAQNKTITTYDQPKYLFISSNFLKLIIISCFLINSINLNRCGIFACDELEIRTGLQTLFAHRCVGPKSEWAHIKREVDSYQYAEYEYASYDAH